MRDYENSEKETAGDLNMRQGSRLIIKNLSKSFLQGQQFVPVFANVSFKIRSGEIVAVMGPSGSGKSTLLHIVAALSNPDNGSVYVNGINIADLDEPGKNWLRSRHLGMVFQNFSLLPSLTALENVALGLQPRKMALQEKKHQAYEILKSVGLGDRTDHRPEALSGGQKQRVAVARALIGGRELVLADEPTANLDKTNTEELLRVFGAMRDNMGASFLIATHDSLVADFSDRVVDLGECQNA